MPCAHLWMSFSWFVERLLDAFWTPFGSILDIVWVPFGSRDVPGVHFGEFVIFCDFLERLRRERGTPFWHHFSFFDDILAIDFLSFVWLHNFLTFCSFGVHLGSNLGAFLGYLGTLKTSLKRWREYAFHTLEVLVAGMISRLDWVSDFFAIFYIFNVFRTSILGVCWGKCVWKWRWTKKTLTRARKG